MHPHLSPGGRGSPSEASEPGEGAGSALRSRPPHPPRSLMLARTLSERGAARRSQKHLLRRRRRPVDLRLARRRGRQHPALRARFPRRHGDPAGAQLPLDRPHPRRRLAPDRPQRRPARQDAAHRRRARREGHRHRRLGFRGRSPRHRRGDRAIAARAATRSTRSPSWCAPRSRCANSRTASSRSACPIA